MNHIVDVLNTTQYNVANNLPLSHDQAFAGEYYIDRLNVYPE